jgi:hypothetical protein
MNYIPYPRLDLDSHRDLLAWRAKIYKRHGDWTMLKQFLHDCTIIGPAPVFLPKCWFSELPQGDDYALDVEHFRPKNSGNALASKHIKQIKQFDDKVNFQQNPGNGTYPWLEFDYRNYRLVTAKTNRAGAKHIYFSIPANTIRLQLNEFPWTHSEFPFFLDPTDPLDAKLLFVKPNGEISPLTPKTQLTQKDYDQLPATWRNDGFNYLRSIITIVLFNLNYKHFRTGRYHVFSQTTSDIGILEKLIIENPRSSIIKDLIGRLALSVLPSAPFSLAAKSAITAYQSTHPDKGVRNNMNQITRTILHTAEHEVNKIIIDWNRP